MKKQFVICLLRVAVLLLCVTASAQKAPVRAGATLSHQVALRHPGIPSNKPKTYTLYQIRNQKGFPTGYTMVVDSVICMEKTCQIINVKMVWDAMGGYLRYELEKGKVLEKGVPLGKSKALLDKAASYKGVPFTDADYSKLDQILRDDRSILSTQRLGDMSVVGDNANLDGVTGATPMAMKEAVVEGASLTCFQLWHWANGEIVEVAKELTHLSCSEDLLRSFLCSDQPHYILFALEHLTRHKQFSPSVVKAVNKVMRGGDHDRIEPSLAYLKEAMPEAQYYNNLAVMFNESNSKRRIHLLELLEFEKKLPGTLFDKMSAALPSMNTYYEFHRLLRLTEKHKHVSQLMFTRASRLLERNNFFIARRAFWYLEKQTLDEQIKNRMQAFRDKCRKERRILN